MIIIIMIIILLLLITIINMRMLVQLNSFTHLRSPLVPTDRGFRVPVDISSVVLMVLVPCVCDLFGSAFNALVLV